MTEKKLCIIIEDEIGTAQTSIETDLSAPQLMEKILKLEEENKELKHELDSLSGCYCADNKEFKDYWRIGYEEGGDDE